MLGSQRPRPAAGAVLGSQRPRLYCAPKSAYSWESGREAVEHAAMAGLILDDWQAWWLTQHLAERRDGQYSAFESMLICSRQNGKGSPVEARELAGLFLFGEELLIHTAHQFKTALEAFRRVLRRIESTPELDRQVMRVSKSHGEEGIELRNGNRLLYFARSEHAGRGFSGDFVCYDEAQDLDAADVGSTMPAVSARPNPQIVYTGTAGGKRATQLARLRRRMLAGGDEWLFAAEWSIVAHEENCRAGCEVHDDRDDVASYAKANPALGGRLTVEAVERERLALTPDVFDKERLGIGDYPDPSEGWAVISERDWSARMDTDAPRPRGPVFAIDTTPTRSYTSIGCAGGRDDGRVGIEVLEHERGTSWVVARAAAIDRRWGPGCTWVVDTRGPAGSLIADLEDADNGPGLTVVSPTAQEVAHGCGQFYDAVKDDGLAQTGDAVLRAAVAGATWRRLGEARAFDRQNLSVVLSPLMVVMLAYWGYVKYGSTSYDVGASVGFDATEVIRLLRMGTYGTADIARLRSIGILDDAALQAIAEAGIPLPPGI